MTNQKAGPDLLQGLSKHTTFQRQDFKYIWRDLCFGMMTTAKPNGSLCLNPHTKDLSKSLVPAWVCVYPAVSAQESK